MHFIIESYQLCPVLETLQNINDSSLRTDASTTFGRPQLTTDRRISVELPLVEQFLQSLWLFVILSHFVRPKYTG